MENSKEFDFEKDLIVSGMVFVDESAYTFPQANSFERILENFNWFPIKEGANAKEISAHNEFVERQGSYYLSALSYLGVIKKEMGNRYFLTDLGLNMKKMSEKERNQYFVRQMFKHKTFFDCFQAYLQCMRIPSLDSIVTIMKTNGINFNNNEGMYRRRASTVYAWLKWIVENVCI